MFAKSEQKIQWEVIQGLLKDAIYGGRIDDHSDELKIATYLRQFFNDEVLVSEGRQANQKLCKALSI
jgi:hypothetical protein